LEDRVCHVGSSLSEFGILRRRNLDHNVVVIVRILTAMGAWAPVLVFLLAAGESAAFLGLFLPGEVAVILGGVIAGTGIVPLWVMMPIAVLGAVIGDSVGFWLGKRFGPWVLGRPRMARFARRLDVAQSSLARRGWWALVVARFTSFLRAVVPFAAGMAAMPYRSFLVGNVIGGVLWGSAYTLVGFVAGDSWPSVEHWLGRGGLILAGVAIVIGGIVWSGRWVARNPGRVVGWFEPLAHTRVVRALTRTVEGPARRIAPLSYLWPAALAIVGGLWLFAGLLQDVLGQDEFFFFDRRVIDYVASHQIPAINGTARFLGTLTPAWVTIGGCTLVAIAMLVRRHPLRAAGIIVAAGGQWVIVEATRLIVARPAPQVTALVSRGDYGFPSEYMAAFALLLVILVWPWRPRRWERTVFGFAAGALAVTIVGAARVVLLLAYPSDILAGVAVGTGWAVLSLIASDSRTLHAIREAAARPLGGKLPKRDVGDPE
jgi:membrane protein DedA with SNARE-associated domain/membrane-associated phospholipid phosphatase